MIFKLLLFGSIGLERFLFESEANELKPGCSSVLCTGTLEIYAIFIVNSEPE